MNEEKTIQVSNWNELLDFVETIDTSRETLVLSGWINTIKFGNPYLKYLLFTTKPIEVINYEVEKNGKNSSQSQKQRAHSTKKRSKKNT